MLSFSAHLPTSCCCCWLLLPGLRMLLRCRRMLLLLAALNFSKVCLYSIMLQLVVTFIHLGCLKFCRGNTGQGVTLIHKGPRRFDPQFNHIRFMEINPSSLSVVAFQSSFTHVQLHTYNIAAVKGLSPKKNQLSYLQYMETILQSDDDKCYFIRPTPGFRLGWCSVFPFRFRVLVFFRLWKSFRAGFPLPLALIMNPICGFLLGVESTELEG